MMHMYRGLNCDNQTSSPSMSVKIKTKFMGLGRAKNFRVRKAWVNSGILGARPLPVRTYMDARNATSDSTIEEAVVYGEYKNPITAIHISSQDALTSRQTPRHNNAKGQNVSFEVSETVKDCDTAISSFEAEIIEKPLKRSHHVGV